MTDKKTTEVAAALIAKFDAALEAGDLAEMERIVEAAAGSPNRPFGREILRQLGE